MRYSWKWISAVCALIVGIAATVAVAAPSGGGGGDQGAQTRAEVRLGGPGPGGHERNLSALAKELGVSTSDLRKAIEAVREKLGPRERPPGPGARKSRVEAEKRCEELTDALASELGKDGDDVRAAIKSVIKADIEAAVKAERLTRAEANRMLERINSADCLPPFLHGRHGVKCAGPGGPGERGGRGGRLEFHGPPPADGNGSNGAELPAPPPVEGVPLI